MATADMRQTEKPHKKSFSGKGVFPVAYAFTLLIPLRNMFLSPKTLISRLGLKEDHCVLEIGPGPGYFSLPVARALKKGRLVLLDLQQGMLDISRKRLEKRAIRNVDYQRCDGTGFELEKRTFDRVFMVTVLGEVDNKDQYIEEIRRVLKDDGMVSITELAGDPDKLSREELQHLLGAHGFELVESFGNKRNETLNFRKTVR